MRNGVKTMGKARAMRSLPDMQCEPLIFPLLPTPYSLLPPVPLLPSLLPPFFSIITDIVWLANYNGDFDITCTPRDTRVSRAN